MKFQIPLLEGTLIKRYKRFLADVKLNDSGEIIVAHVPNSGSMLGVKDPGSACRVSISPNPNRKLRHTLEMVQSLEGQWVGVNTSLTNSLVHEAFMQKSVSEWEPYAEIQREVKVSDHTRLDFLLKGKNLRYVEVKNVSMARPPQAVFPDAVTERGQKHLAELAKLATQKGVQAEIFFVVQRQDCEVFKPCDDIDPEYGKLLRQVAQEKVIIRCWECKISRDEIRIHRPLPVDLSI